LPAGEEAPREREEAQHPCVEIHGDHGVTEYEGAFGAGRGYASRGLPVPTEVADHAAMRKPRSRLGLACLASLAAVGACRSPAPTQAMTAHPWTAEFTPPETLDTGRVHLEPLQPRHAELDFAAFMSSRETLQKTLHWGSWPPADFTVERNRKDLEHHWADFVGKRGYTYTVLAPDRSKCVGCVYLYPPDREAKPGDDRAQLSFWVIDAEIPGDLDEHLLKSVLAWVAKDFTFREVFVPIHRDNARGLAIARKLGLPETQEWRERPADVVFVWRK
jgi:RimJ/RimL family protein N-acetyltransferase